MMNLFARILSHGFGLIVVALLALGLIYRGKLFPDWELPDFLSFDSAQEETTETVPADIQRDTGLEAVTGAESVPPVPATGEIAADTADITGVQDELPVPAAETMPAETAPAAEAEAVEEAAGDVTAAAVEPVAEEGELAEGAGAEAPAAEEPAAEEPAAEAVAAEEPVAEAPAAEAVAVEEPVAEAPAAEEPAAEEGGQPAEAMPAPESAIQEAAEAAPAEETVTEVAAIPEAEAVPAETTDVEAAGAATPAATEAGIYRLLAEAREAYWLRDYALAEQKYRELIALQPGNPDGYGELGNMYFSQGDWEQAAAAYYEAGVRLADEGYSREAEQMVEVIRGLNGPQAGDLEQRLRSAGQ